MGEGEREDIKRLRADAETKDALAPHDWTMESGYTTRASLPAEEEEESEPATTRPDEPEKAGRTESVVVERLAEQKVDDELARRVRERLDRARRHRVRDGVVDVAGLEGAEGLELDEAGVGPLEDREGDWVVLAVPCAREKERRA